MYNKFILIFYKHNQYILERIIFRTLDKHLMDTLPGMDFYRHLEEDLYLIFICKYKIFVHLQCVHLLYT